MSDNNSVYLDTSALAKWYISESNSEQVSAYIIELDNGDRLRVMKPEVFQYEFNVSEEINYGLFKDDILLYKYPKNLQKEMDLQ